MYVEFSALSLFTKICSGDDDHRYMNDILVKRTVALVICYVLASHSSHVVILFSRIGRRLCDLKAIHHVDAIEGPPLEMMYTILHFVR